jgi:CRISPR type III-B/RAMP module-associated protein Cmr5
MTIERRIAGQAKDLVREQAEKTTEHKQESEYRSLCESFPMLLRSAGLAQTVSYLRAKTKSKREYGALYGHLQTQFRNLEFLAAHEELVEKAADPKLSQADYRLYSEIAMKAALWHKRLAQALLRKKGE